MRTSLAVLVLLTVLPALAAASSTLPWGPDGLAIATGPAKQRAPECWPDGQGGLLVSWAEPRDGGLQDILIQRLGRDGLPAPGWPAGGIRRTGVLAIDYPPAVFWREVGAAIAPAGDGGFYLAWRDQRFVPPGAYWGDLFVVRHDASGSVAPGWPAEGIALSVSPAWESDPVLLPDGSGGLFAAWSINPSDRGGSEVRVDHVLADTTRPPGWSVNGVPTTRGGAPELGDIPVIVPDGAGGILVGWRALWRSSDVGRCFGLSHVLANGATDPQWPDEGISIGAGQCQDLRLVAGPAGDAYAVWTEIPLIGTWAPWRVHAVRISANGVRPGWPDDGLIISPTSYSSSNTRAVSDGAGGLFVVWHNYLGDYAFDVRVQRLDPQGRFMFPAEALPTGSSEGNVDYLRAIPDGHGGAITSWAAGTGGYDNDLFSRSVSASGRESDPFSMRGTPSTMAVGNQVALDIASDGDGGHYAAWVDLSSDALGDIYVQWIPAEKSAPDPTHGFLDLRLYPNPARDVITLRLTLSEPRRVEAAVFDLAGARVRTLIRGHVFGQITVPWDWRDDRGRRLPPGVYLVETNIAGERTTRRIVRTR